VAVATSGDYARFFRLGGQRYSHIIDPRDGWPVDHSPSVTVVAETAMKADALATAASVMEPKEALNMIDSLSGTECVIMNRKEDGGVDMHFSKNVREMLESDGGSP
jgi:thiamine biosynthesis lipoprotein